VFIKFKLAHNEKIHHQDEHREHIEHVDKEKDGQVDNLELCFVLLLVERRS